MPEREYQSASDYQVYFQWQKSLSSIYHVFMEPVLHCLLCGIPAQFDIDCPGFGLPAEIIRLVELARASFREGTWYLGDPDSAALVHRLLTEIHDGQVLLDKTYKEDAYA